ncbi:MAG: acyl-ACP--UDP-N-acetylglucosamine O-acyltransferase [bacterium]|nr:acyl-ACP--UDP-N-acetylglucosamine O-acyltransferase [bacterium]
MSNIHPTAIIDSQAKVHESVQVGPYSVIDAGVDIDADTVIDSHVRVYSGAKIGKSNRIYHGAAIGGDPQNVGFDYSIKSGVRIGDHNVLREFFIIHRSSEAGVDTTIGNHCFLMENSIVSHDSTVGDHVVFVHAAATSGHVIVQDYAFVSGLTAIHQFCTIGEFAMVAGCAKIVKDVPPYATADGNPATIIGLNTVGLKRGGFSPETRKKVKETYKTLYHSGLNRSQALKKLNEENDPNPEVKKIVQFFTDSERGVTDHR